MRALGITPPPQLVDPATVYGPPIAPRIGSISRFDPSKEKEKGKRGASKKRAFLAAYVATAGNLSRAAAAAGVHRSVHYLWLAEDPAYREAFAVAEPQAADVLEDEGRRRAFEGCWKPVHYKGELVDYELVYSDAIWLAMMKAKKPREYGQIIKGTGEKGAIQVELQVADDTLAKLTDEQLQSGIRELRAAEDRIRDMLDQAARNGSGSLPPGA